MCVLEILAELMAEYITEQGTALFSIELLNLQ